MEKNLYEALNDIIDDDLTDQETIDSINEALDPDNLMTFDNAEELFDAIHSEHLADNSD